MIEFLALRMETIELMVRFGSLWKDLHNSHYAKDATMRSSMSEYLAASMRKLGIVLHRWRLHLTKIGMVGMFGSSQSDLRPYGQMKLPVPV